MKEGQGPLLAIGLGFLLLAALGLTLLKGCGQRGALSGSPNGVGNAEEVARYRERVIVYDTAFIDMPVPRDSVVVRYVTAKLPVSNSQLTMHNAQLGDDKPLQGDSQGRDSVEVEMPMTLTEYRDSNYVAWVSGYMATLDSIRVINRKEVVTETILMKERKKWGFTVGPTVGVGWNGRGVEPYVGVGLTWGFSF